MIGNTFVLIFFKNRIYILRNITLKKTDSPSYFPFAFPFFFLSQIRTQMIYAQNWFNQFNRQSQTEHAANTRKSPLYKPTTSYDRKLFCYHDNKKYSTSGFSNIYKCAHTQFAWRSPKCRGGWNWSRYHYGLEQASRHVEEADTNWTGFVCQLDWTRARRALARGSMVMATSLDHIYSDDHRLIFIAYIRGDIIYTHTKYY